MLWAREVEIDSHRHHRLHVTLDAEPLVVRPPVRITLEDVVVQVAATAGAP